MSASAGPRLRVTYPSASELARELEPQLARGGVLARCEVPPSLVQYARAVLEVSISDDALGAEVDAEVVQIFPGIGVALALDPTACATLAALAAGTAASPGRAPAPETIAQKIQRAVHGRADDRARTLRDPNRALHAYVLQNPGLELDEVLGMTRSTNASPELLRAIAEHRTFGVRPDVCLALVRSPRTPIDLAVRLVDRVSASDARQLAKSPNVRPEVQRVARKRVLGPP